MTVRSRGTRRAGRLTLLGCVLLWGAAETGGAWAPPCADATPYSTMTTTAIKPVGDPDTPDEGPHPVKLLSGGTSVSYATLAGHPTGGQARFSLWEWLRSLIDRFQEE